MNAAMAGKSGDAPTPVSTGSIEDRRHPRFRGDLPPVKINDLGANWQGLLAFMIDLSERGFCLRIPFVLAMGNSFNFELALPDGAVVRGTAQCRWSRAEDNWLSWVCGSEIIGIHPGDADRWESYVHHFQPTARA